MEWVKKYLNWSREHLNWAWTIGVCISTILAIVIISPLIQFFIGMIGWFLSYFICILAIIEISYWVYRQKGRNLWWILLPFSPLWLTNNNSRKDISTIPDSIQSQTSAEGRSDGCNETRTHSDKTGDI